MRRYLLLGVAQLVSAVAQGSAAPETHLGENFEAGAGQQDWTDLAVEAREKRGPFTYPGMTIDDLSV